MNTTCNGLVWSWTSSSQQSTEKLYDCKLKDLINAGTKMYRNQCKPTECNFVNQPNWSLPATDQIEHEPPPVDKGHWTTETNVNQPTWSSTPQPRQTAEMKSKMATFCLLVTYCYKKLKKAEDITWSNPDNLQGPRLRIQLYFGYKLFPTVTRKHKNSGTLQLISNLDRVINSQCCWITPIRNTLKIVTPSAHDTVKKLPPSANLHIHTLHWGTSIKHHLQYLSYPTNSFHLPTL